MVEQTFEEIQVFVNQREQTHWREWDPKKHNDPSLKQFSYQRRSEIMHEFNYHYLTSKNRLENEIDFVLKTEAKMRTDTKTMELISQVGFKYVDIEGLEELDRLRKFRKAQQAKMQKAMQGPNKAKGAQWKKLGQTRDSIDLNVAGEKQPDVNNQTFNIDQHEPEAEDSLILSKAYTSKQVTAQKTVISGKSHIEQPGKNKTEGPVP